MASTRKLKSGRYQGKAYRPDGKPSYKTFDLQRQAQHWAEEEEARYRRGDTRDPRSANMLVGEWYKRWIAVKGGTPGTRRKTEALWRGHCDKQWARWPMGTVTRLEAQGWVRVLEQKLGPRGKPLAAATVHEIVLVMSSLYNAALRETPPLIAANPFTDLKLPVIPPTPLEFYTPEEADALLAALERWPERQALVELGLWSGMREGEMFGLLGDRVRWLGRKGDPGVIQVHRVMTRDGLRDYPKTRKSFRDVPVRPSTMEKLRPLMAGRSLDSHVFTRAEGGAMDDTWFRWRVWNPAVERAGIRDFPPTIMRHTAASWLVQGGMPLPEVQRLLGHESYTTTQRYAKLAPGAHDAVLNMWKEIERKRRAG